MNKLKRFSPSVKSLNHVSLNGLPNVGYQHERRTGKLDKIQDMEKKRKKKSLSGRLISFPPFVEEISTNIPK